MGVYEGRGQLSKAMKELSLRWSEVRMNWDDSVRRGFEDRYLVPLQMDLRTAVGAMDHMAVLLQQARRDCE